MKTNIRKRISTVLVGLGTILMPLPWGGVGVGFLTSCSDDFLEVTNPNGEPLEEYYTTEGTLNEALTSAYAPLHWPDWDNQA